MSIDRIFVFGSNLAGRHGKGAALHAKQAHDAEYGVGIGRTGNAYAIPTKDARIRTLPLDRIAVHVAEFLAYARAHPNLDFQVTKIGCGLAGYQEQDIAPMFKDAPNNCHLPDLWRSNQSIPKEAPMRTSTDTPLNQQPADSDRVKAAAIEGRRVGGYADPETAHKAALADVQDFVRIKDPAWQTDAAVQIAASVQEDKHYKAGLERAVASHPGVPQKIASLDVKNTAKVNAKEDRKAAELQSMLREKVVQAKSWSPEQATQHAVEDLAAYRIETSPAMRHYLQGDMRLNADVNPSYKSALDHAARDVIVGTTTHESTIGAGTNMGLRVTPTGDPKHPTKSQDDRVIGTSLSEFLAHFDPDRAAVPSDKAAAGKVATLAAPDGPLASRTGVTADHDVIHIAAGSVTYRAEFLKDEVNTIAATRPEHERAPGLGEPIDDVRAKVLDTHQSSALFAEQGAQPGVQERFDAERDAITRMQPSELKQVEQAQTKGPEQAERVIGETMKQMQAEVEIRPKQVPPKPLEDRYNIVKSGMFTKNYEVREQPGKVAFSERFLTLKTATNDASAITAMVERASEKGWGTVTLSGTLDFQRQAWIAATAHGITAVGYTPTPGDREAAAREAETVAANRQGGSISREAAPREGGTIERHGLVQANPVKGPDTDTPQAAAAPGSAPTPAAVAKPNEPSQTITDRQLSTLIEKAIRDAGVPPGMQDKVRTTIQAEATKRTERGETFTKVHIFDAAAKRPLAPEINFAAPTRSQPELTR